MTYCFDILAKCNVFFFSHLDFWLLQQLEDDNEHLYHRLGYGIPQGSWRAKDACMQCPKLNSVESNA